MKDNLIEIGKLDIKIIDGDRGENYPTKEDFFENEYCLFLDAKNITSTGFNLSTTQFITQKKDNELRNGKLKRNDIVMMTRGSVGNVALFDEKIPFENIRINSGMIIIRCEGKYSPKLLYYLLKSSFVKKQINDMMSGSVQKHLTSSSIKQIKILKNYTSIKIDTIYAIDSKIQLNNKINSELEAMAKTIYDYWFLQFKFPNKEGKPYKSSGGKMVWNDELKREIPEGWEIKSIFDELSVQYGFPFATDKFTDVKTDIPVVRIRDILTNTISTYSNENVDKKYRLNEQDLLIGMDGNFHMNYWIDNTSYLNQRSVRLRTKDTSNVSIIQVKYNIAPYIKAKEERAGGSTVGHLSDKDLKELKILVPKTKKLREILDNTLMKIVKNRKENQELTSLRDFLLPLLMNGQVGFKEE